MQSTFFLQSERMDVTVGSIKMPVAVLNVFNTVIILVLIPVMDRGIYPLLAKFGRSPSHLQRIGKHIYHVISINLKLSVSSHIFFIS